MAANLPRDNVNVNPKMVRQRLVPIDRRQECVIVCEQWPGWTWAIEGLPFHATKVYLRNLDFQPWCSPTTMASVLPFESIPRQMNGTLFVSGSARFCTKIAKTTTATGSVFLALEGSSRQRTPDLDSTWHSVTLRHAETGGCTTGSLRLRHNCTAPFNLTPHGYPRRLRHIIDPVAKGVPTRVIPEPGDARVEHNTIHWIAPGTVHVGGLAPMNPHRFAFACPSVFSPTGWSARSLTSREIARLYDMPVDIEMRVADLPGLEVPFLGSIPVQLLRTCAVSVRDWLGMRGGEILDDVPLPEKGVQRPSPGWISQGDEHLEEGEESTNPKSTATTADPPRKDDKGGAAKRDDAAVPVHLWNNRIMDKQNCSLASRDQYVRTLDWFRERLVRFWKRLVLRSFCRYMRHRHGRLWWQPRRNPSKREEHERDLEGGRDCLARASRVTWWEWTDGSRTFFWRWPIYFRRQVRDGLTPWIQGQLPSNLRPRKMPTDSEMRAAIRGKLEKVRFRRYVESGFVQNLTPFFGVDKADGDIRLVFDCAQSLINEALYAPSFALPTIEGVMRALGINFFGLDLDLGEFFLNFELHECLRPFVGVDLSAYFPAEIKEGCQTLWERWCRCLFGLKISPYNTIRSFLIAEEIIRGDRLDSNNTFRWDHIRLNLPGQDQYNPSLPWVSKVREDEQIANDFLTYVDDVRATGGTEDECWLAGRRVASVSSYLGVQDAPRKRRPPSRQPGAWAGSVVQSLPEGLGLMVTEQRWVKTKSHVRDLIREFRSEELMDARMLESKGGFLVYVGRTYRSFRPYLKGIFLTLNAWRPNRDPDGWKIIPSFQPEELIGWAEDTGREKGAPAAPQERPERLRPVPRLEHDLKALERLTAANTPPVRFVRRNKLVLVFYGGGDASGAGFGSAVPNRHGLVIRHGIWMYDEDEESSNYRELKNLVLAVRDASRDGGLDNAELFLFTDNSTAEWGYYNGTCHSPALFELLLELHEIEQECALLLHVIHIAGTRMIELGIDGLSRGSLLEGAMKNPELLNSVPLHLSAFERDPDGNLLSWFRDWMMAPRDFEPLTPDQWFVDGQGFCGGTEGFEGIWMPKESRQRMFLWAPAPAAAVVAIEELRKSRHKRPHLFHVFVCPRLMIPLWKKGLYKEADFMFEVPVGSSLWPSSSHEPLVVAVCLPFIRHRPWKLQRMPKLLAMERSVRRMFKTPGGDPRHLLRELRLLPRKLDAMSEGVVWRLLHATSGR